MQQRGLRPCGTTIYATNNCFHSFIAGTIKLGTIKQSAQPRNYNSIDLFCQIHFGGKRNCYLKCSTQYHTKAQRHLVGSVAVVLPRG